MRPMRWVLLLLFLAPVGEPTLAGERADRLNVFWGRSLPDAEEESDRGPHADPPKPLLVLIACEKDTRDQRRFNDVVMKSESLLLAAKFFQCVDVREETAREHALFEGIKFRAPAAIAFDSTRKHHALAGGRASAMKIYGILVKVGQADYETSIAGTVRNARNLLGKFDQVDAARDSLTIKRQRLDEATVKGNRGKIATLKRECEKDQKAIDRLHSAATEEWRKIWNIKRKKRAGKKETAEKDEPDEKEGSGSKATPEKDGKK